MENNKQTAVEWLYSHLFPKQLDGFSSEEWDKIDKSFEQAKQMEKEQHIKTATHFFPTTLKREHFEHYYNETYV